MKLLEGFGDGIGMDCSIQPTKYPELFLISTTDFFYPLVHDPYLQGRIGCANVLSDLYSMAVVDCDTILMLLAASLDMSETDRNIVSRLMIEGFNEAAKEAGTKVTGGQTVLNPWPIIGGVAMSTCKTSDFVYPVNAVPGDVLVLTKPLGTQVAVNVFQWSQSWLSWRKVSGVLTEAEAKEAYAKACESMGRLNRNGARLMHKYGAHAATDITGFGYLGHARNLASNQKAAVRFELHTLPIIAHMRRVDDAVQLFKLLQGFSAETSGGLLVALPAANAPAFCQELQQLDGQPAWIVGTVVSSPDGSRDALISPNPHIIEI